MTMHAAHFHSMTKYYNAYFLVLNFLSVLHFLLYSMSASDTFSSSCNISQSYEEIQKGAEGPAAGSNALMDSEASEQRGLTGSKVTALTLVERRSLLLCWLVLDVTSRMNLYPVFPPLLVFLTYLTSLSTQSLIFYGSVCLSWRAFALLLSAFSDVI